MAQFQKTASVGSMPHIDGPVSKNSERRVNATQFAELETNNPPAFGKAVV